MKARTVEGKAADITKPGNASVKAFALPERVRDETRVGTSEGAFRSMRLVDLLYRTAVYVIRVGKGTGKGTLVQKQIIIDNGVETV
jgi:hypothetical protein